jgi:branched-chain amino acid transport system permease protein
LWPFLNFIVIPGLAYGSQLALGALGVTLIFGVLRFSNFAHGDTMAFGTAFVIMFTWLVPVGASALAPCRPRFWPCPSALLATIAMVLATDRGSIAFTASKRPSRSSGHRIGRRDVRDERSCPPDHRHVEERNFTDGARMC